MTMSKEQIEEHRLRMYAHKHRKLFQATMDNPELLEKCKELINNYVDEEANHDQATGKGI
jgi:Fe-S cluster biosynthesis and repair protein YggX